MAIPTSPSTLRTPRTQALKMGTDPRGFEGQIPYDAHAGIPMGVTGAGQSYQSAGPFVGGPGGAINTATPFANLKSK